MEPHYLRAGPSSAKCVCTQNPAGMCWKLGFVPLWAKFSPVYRIAQLDRPIFHIIAATEVSVSRMPDEKYRITSPTIVLFLQEGDFVSQMIPDGTVITL